MWASFRLSAAFIGSHDCENSVNDLTTMMLLFQVTYQTELFLDKNKDYVIAEHQALLNASTCSFVANLFPPAPDDSKQSKFSSIGTRFKVCLIWPA